MNKRAVAVVIDPIQSVKGKVVIDAFRCIEPTRVMMGLEPRQTTSNIGHLNKPSIQVGYVCFVSANAISVHSWGHLY
jgi:26S proteasome regulatory subunit N11